MKRNRYVRLGTPIDAWRVFKDLPEYPGVYVAVLYVDCINAAICLHSYYTFETLTEVAVFFESKNLRRRTHKGIDIPKMVEVWM